MTTKQYFSCPECQKPCRWDPELAGRSVLCRRCRQKIRVPQQLTADVEHRPNAQNPGNDSWGDSWDEDQPTPEVPSGGDSGSYYFMDTPPSPAAPAPHAGEMPAPPPPLFPMPSAPYPANGAPTYPMPGSGNGNGNPAPQSYMPGPPMGPPTGPLPPPPGYYPSNNGPPNSGPANYAPANYAPPSYAPSNYGPPGYPPQYPSAPGGYSPPPAPYPYSGPAASPPSYGYPPTAPAAPPTPTVSTQPRSVAAQRSARSSGGSWWVTAITALMGLLGIVCAIVFAYEVILPMQQDQARLKALEASLETPDFDFNAVEPTNSPDQPSEPSIPAFPELTARYPDDWPELFRRKTAAMENGLTGNIRNSILSLPAHVAEAKRVQGRWSKGEVAASWTINGYNVEMTLLGPDKKLGTDDDFKFRFNVSEKQPK